jgi:hypothetical protein
VTAVQVAAAAGALIGLGIVLIGLRWLPAQPDLANALDRLAPEHSLAAPVSVVAPVGAADRVGRWAIRYLPISLAPPPMRDLDLLGMPLHRFYGQKVLYTAFGLALPLGLTAMVTVIGMHPPFILPAAASLALAALLGFIPDLNIRSDAAAAREQFTRALSAYIDLVALERLAGAGPRQAMESAAAIGDSWPFRRITEELARSRWSGVAPWDALGRLAVGLGLDSLNDLSDIMRLSGEQGAAVYQSLRARSAAMRSALVTEELAAANRTAERLTLPGALLALTFAVLLTAPAMIRLVSG